MRFWPWRKPKPSPADMSTGLRDKALSMGAAELNLSPTDDLPNVFAVIMEFGWQSGAVSLVTFTDGTTSLYFHGGGGIIGAGEIPAVRKTLPAFFAEAEERLASFAPTVATPLPTRGRVRFYVRTFAGNVTAEADEQDLGNSRHELSPLFHAGHAVISAIRVSQEQRPGA